MKCKKCHKLLQCDCWEPTITLLPEPAATGEEIVRVQQVGMPQTWNVRTNIGDDARCHNVDEVLEAVDLAMQDGAVVITVERSQRPTALNSATESAPAAPTQQA